MRSDLGRILRSSKYVQIACHSARCSFRGPTLHAKPAALRLARRHAALTGHTVRLYLHHYQDVEPRTEA